ncbi:MAG: class I SAM-dependent DNA methyltransferase [Thermoguttaceae bacterium]|nr:class I SAM-dependent DNA methyltransferase [Thermoguttaceae bacterium]
MLSDAKQRLAAKEFVKYWRDRGDDEKGECSSFWLSLLRDVFGVDHPERFAIFEERVKVESTNFIDVHIPSTRVVIEQKKRSVDLLKKYKRSDGQSLTPFGQAKRYSDDLPYSQRARWIVACNFQKFLVYDMERPKSEPEEILLENLADEFYRLRFLVESTDQTIAKETEISIQAGDLVGVLYDALYRQYRDPENPDSARSLNMLCVRIVFCLYAEDAGLFGSRLQFHDYIKSFPVPLVRQGLIDLFQVLDQKPEERDPYISERLAAFPYVNGGLFSDEHIEIPQFTPEIVDLLLNKASKGFDWSQISPTIFGAVFESTLNPETRRKGGMHYTSIENIHKTIDPLFLDDLREELDTIKEVKQTKDRNDKLVAFQKKLGGLTFFDPACGSGNFLTETYISLRKLENEALRIMYPEKILFSADDKEHIVNVSIDQFYGIEINDFAVTVARTALWIAESQAMKATEDILQIDLDFLPLKGYANIVEGNALRIDWENVFPKESADYIMGNPPFIGYSLQSDDQKKDVLSVYVDEKGKPYRTAGKIDYVSCWYFKASQYIQNTNVRVAFVSTNSITQGEQVASVWKPLFERFGIHIDFAHRTFRWDSEANLMAHVHCVIVGFSVAALDKPKRIFDGDSSVIVHNINAYLNDAPNVFIESRSTALCNVPPMAYGNKPTDGGGLFLTPEERLEVIKREPGVEKYIRRVYGAAEYINNKERYCLWLVDASPSDVRNSTFIRGRVGIVREFRNSSPKEATRKSAETPTLFQEIRHPRMGEYVIVPRVTSENRRYIPLGFVSCDIVVTDAMQMIPDAMHYHFGVLTSSVHMAWMRTVCGRLKSDYRYSKDVVYNNFPWPELSDAAKDEISRTAQGILDARDRYPESSLADLYDELSMPPDLRKAHQANDRVVLKAYGLLEKTSESEIVAELIKRYLALVELV